MKTYAERLYAALELQLAENTTGNNDLIEQYKAAIQTSKKAMSKLKSYISTYAFESREEEVLFFKTVKPLFYSKYIYYINVHNFLLQRPAGGEQIRQDYIRMHLAELKTFFDHNRAFYSYYRSGMTQLDEIYYTRGGFDVHAELEDFEEDEQYSTSHDYKLSKIMANERFQDYLNLELAKIGKEELIRPLPFKYPNWTASQVDAVELLYSLKSSGAINHGNIDISELVVIFEFIFQTELHETYHKVLDITRRKKDPLVFLTRLRNSMENFVQEKFN